LTVMPQMCVVERDTEGAISDVSGVRPSCGLQTALHLMGRSALYGARDELTKHLPTK